VPAIRQLSGTPKFIQRVTNRFSLSGKPTSLG